MIDWSLIWVIGAIGSIGIGIVINNWLKKDLKRSMTESQGGKEE